MLGDHTETGLLLGSSRLLSTNGGDYEQVSLSPWSQTGFDVVSKGFRRGIQRRFQLGLRCTARGFGEDYEQVALSALSHTGFGVVSKGSQVQRWLLAPNANTYSASIG